mmetsp:Transcript_14944/g.16910  ORF Transcript_14944/g.16910 Transcript_14944/m.16910 type:complete len:102 (+) Transcript_14944:702-1007(+)
MLQVEAANSDSASLEVILFITIVCGTLASRFKDLYESSEDSRQTENGVIAGGRNFSKTTIFACKRQFKKLNASVCTSFFIHAFYMSLHFISHRCKNKVRKH